MTEHLCVIGGCVDFGQHHDDCDNPRCRGCRPRIAERPAVCEVDRRQLPGNLDHLETLWRQLCTRDDHTDTTQWTVRQLQRWPIPTTNPVRLAPWAPGSWTAEPGSDATLHSTSAAPVARSHQRRVSGSRHAPIPANLTQLDLAAPARQGSRAPHARGVLGLDPDQIGHLAIATELDTWARDWRDTLCPEHHLPVPTVPALVAWLKNRLDDACTRHEGIDEFAADITAMRKAATATLGLNPARKELCKGVTCRSCDRKTLYRDGENVQCAWCHQYYSEREYTDWVALLDADAKRRGLRPAEDEDADRPEATPIEVVVDFPDWVAMK
ncbi:hypothetical protein Rhe02_54720 [Rhizocola hellebori]|uniref:Uncharacterized protein n=1 Tax=Rhizocola hellebori TaxID=1392758 RepID=A0A8J3VIA5_9ACTN|nr:hypothetical protein [Rhizocola hellebori]GIH07405.1 hypothetical protein Rhe02_54720 [Rhizocola hellebori]